ncbi:caspase recruitment domain-containing protein 19 isoform X4 [Python bivittatus]|uniref:Caspase recruitment domain-containing protein 19 n=1 Tax=Python bivittatus TaxID=176946 RepID=A0A9F5J347_PYTBI|nr:caspase recruitment domain-containing protein 19 isoform X4 [Python bivittatus]
MIFRKYQTYCDRLRQDKAFLTSNGRLSEQLVDKIILQLNRVYPQILTIKEAEKFRNPKAPLHSRLSNLIAHLQKKGDKPCQEFYRALQINAEHLYNNLPSRRRLKSTLQDMRSSKLLNYKTPSLTICLLLHHKKEAKSGLHKMDYPSHHR